MPKSKPLPTFRATIYQLHGNLDVDQLIREKYRSSDQFTTEDVEIGDRSSVLVWGTTVTDRARWASVLSAWTGNSGGVAEVGNATSAAVLLVPSADAKSGIVWAICFGIGFQLIESSAIVPAFGRQVFVRCAEPEALRSLTSSRLDSRARVARTSIPSGDELAAFGADDLGDVVSRLVGPAVVNGILACKDETAVELRAADALSIPLSKDTSRMLADLDAIEAALRETPRAELEAVEQVAVLRSGDSRIPDLESAFAAALGDPDSSRLGLAWPTELADEASPISSFKLSGLGRGDGSQREFNEIVLNRILSAVDGLPESERVVRLDRMRVQAFSDEGDAVSNALPARRWLAFEVEVDNRRYCLHNGRWYAVDDGLDARLSDRLSSVFAVDHGLGELPPWSAGTDEAAYNELLAAHLHGVCLDRKLVRGDHLARGFEACDVLAPDGTFIHVKILSKSTGASHLFAQAGVSAQRLLDDGSAREELRELVEKEGGDRSWVPDRVERAVLVMGGKRVVTSASLFSFSRMRLVRLDQEFKRQGVSLAVAPVAMASS